MPPPKFRLVKGFGMSQEPDALEAAIERFLLSKRLLSGNTQTHYRQALKHYRTISPDWPPTPESIIRFINWCQANYQDSTVFSYWAVVRGFVRFLVKRRIINDNPLEEIAPPPKAEELPRAPAAEQIERLMSYLEKEVEKVLTKGQKRYGYQGWREVRNLALYSLILDTGLRVNEAVSVHLEDVNLEEWSVFVRNAKRKKQRFVAIGRTCRADLKLWMNYRGLIPMLDSSPGRPYLFLSRRVGWVPMSVANVENTLEKICNKLGIAPAINPHDLRHAFCAYWVEQGGSLEEARKQMGHSSIVTTARYAKSIDDRRLQNHLRSSPRDNLF